MHGESQVVVAPEKCVSKSFAGILLSEDGQNNVRTQKQNRLYNRCNGKKIDADLGSMAHSSRNLTESVNEVYCMRHRIRHQLGGKIYD